MAAASFAALFLWLAIILLGCAFLVAIEELMERRERQRRIARLRERRQYLDQLEPRRWQP